MRILFMGTPAPAARCLEALIDAQETVACVVTQPDRPKGRHLKETPSPVKELALKYKIPIETPEKIKDPVIVDKLRAYDPDLIVVVAYGKILSKELLAVPKKCAINLHASLLPKYRGAAPIQWAILKGENETGVTVMKIAETLDTGDILLQRAVRIDPLDTAATLEEKLFAEGADLLLEAVAQIKEGKEKTKKQNEAEATYAPLITKESGELDFRKSAVEINNRVRALIPWPVAHTFYKEKMLKIHSAEPIPLEGKDKPGEIIKDLTLACGTGALRLKEVQLESGKKMSAEEFLRGHPLKPGDILPS